MAAIELSPELIELLTVSRLQVSMERLFRVVDPWNASSQGEDWLQRLLPEALAREAAAAGAAT